MLVAYYTILHTLCGLMLNFFLPMISFFSLVFSRLKNRTENINIYFKNDAAP
mgnify:CR=1 FL=1